MPVPISNVTRRVVFAASGTGPYAFTFEILAASDIAVYEDDTLLTLTTDYTVTINANGTGSVTLVVSPTGTQIAIVGNRTIARATDFTTGGDFFANTLNDELDQQTIFAQQNAEGLQRALQAPQTDPTSINMVLPRAADRAGKYLAFDVNGNPEPGDTAAEVAGVFAIKDEILALAAIDSEIVAVEAIDADVTTVAGIAGNVTTVAGIAANVTTVAGISADVTTVAADGTDIGTVAGIAADVTAVAAIDSDVTAVAAIDSDVTAVAAIDSDVTTVAGIAANVTTVAGISADVTTVAADGTDIGTVATNIANVNTVAGISADVTTVAADGTDIGTVAGIAANVTTVAGVAANVTTVAGIAANVTTVAGISADVTTVAADGADIGTVATNIANVNAVGGAISNVNTVAGIAADVSTVAADGTDIGTVAGLSTEIAALGAISADITTVAGIDSDVTAVAADATDIGAVASNIASVNTVAGISADITTVAGIDTEVTAVAGIETEITALYADLANINVKVGKTSDTGSAIMPAGTEAQRDGSPSAGYLRFNSDTSSFEGYDGSAWGSIGGGGTPGGSDTQIQYNSGGSFAGASGLVTDGSNLTLNAQGDLRFADSDSSNWVAFQAPATIASNVTWTLPTTDGTNGQALTTNGSGTLTFASIAVAEVATPTNVSPADLATDIGETPTLTGSTYLSLYGKTQKSSQWQVSTDNTFATTDYDSGEVLGVGVTHAVPDGNLSVSTTYYWRVRYRDTDDTYSEYSTPTEFETAASFNNFIATPTATPAIGGALEGGFFTGLIWNQVTQSATSTTIGTGSKTFTVTDSAPLFYSGQAVEVRSRANPSTARMIGTVTASLGTTLIVNVTSVDGSGTLTDWSDNGEVSG
jgi:hypothetical protein